jgi:hypothetical protein
MEALEFSTKIEDGIIRLPKQFEEYDNTVVRVIILAEKPQIFPSKKEKLRAVLKKMQEKDIFRSVSNPVEWQRRLRNEWE